MLLPLWYSVIVLCFVVPYLVSNTSFAIILMGKREVVALLCLSFLFFRDCCGALPRGATGLSAVYDCGIILTYFF